MKNNMDFFTHETDSHSQPEYEALIARYDMAGYGRFWILSELIGKAENCELEISKGIHKNSIAKKLLMSPEEFEEYIQFLSDPNECGLLIIENKKLKTRSIQDDYGRLNSKRKREQERYKQNKSDDSGTPKNPENQEKNDSASENTDSAAETGFLPQSNAETDTEGIGLEGIGLEGIILETRGDIPPPKNLKEFILFSGKLHWENFRIDPSTERKILKYLNILTIGEFIVVFDAYLEKKSDKLNFFKTDFVKWLQRAANTKAELPISHKPYRPDPDREDIKKNGCDELSQEEVRKLFSGVIPGYS